jgi:hypothetical protein
VDRTEAVVEPTTDHVVRSLESPNQYSFQVPELSHHPASQICQRQGPSSLRPWQVKAEDNLWEEDCSLDKYTDDNDDGKLDENSGRYAGNSTVNYAGHEIDAITPTPVIPTVFDSWDSGTGMLQIDRAERVLTRCSLPTYAA